jgi:hypothetical protein
VAPKSVALRQPARSAPGKSTPLRLHTYLELKEALAEADEAAIRARHLTNEVARKVQQMRFELGQFWMSVERLRELGERLSVDVGGVRPSAE